MPCRSPPTPRPGDSRPAPRPRTVDRPAGYTITAGDAAGRRSSRVKEQVGRLINRAGQALDANGVIGKNRVSARSPLRLQP